MWGKRPKPSAVPGDRAVIAPENLSDREGRNILEQIRGLGAAGAKLISADLAGLSRIDSRQAAWLIRFRREAEALGAAVEFINAVPRVGDYISLVIPRTLAPPPPPPREKNFLARLGQRLTSVRKEAGEIRAIVFESVYWSFIAPLEGRGLRIRSVLDEVNEMGTKAVGIVITLNLLLGLVIAMLSAAQLKYYAVPPVLIASLVVIGFARELAVLLTAIVVSARTGSAIAAELATMKVSEEIDALRGMGLSVGKFLIAPRVVAILLVIPILTALGFVAGVAGGFILGIGGLGVSAQQWWAQTIQAVKLNDLGQGLIKSFVFAVLIVIIGCHNGLRVTGGARGVGMGTTRAVVMDIFAIIVADMFFATLFYIIL